MCLDVCAITPKTEAICVLLNAPWNRSLMLFTKMCLGRFHRSGISSWDRT